MFSQVVLICTSKTNSEKHSEKRQAEGTNTVTHHASQVVIWGNQAPTDSGELQAICVYNSRKLGQDTKQYVMIICVEMDCTSNNELKKAVKQLFHLGELMRQTDIVCTCNSCSQFYISLISLNSFSMSSKCSCQVAGAFRTSCNWGGFPAMFPITTHISSYCIVHNISEILKISPLNGPPCTSAPRVKHYKMVTGVW